jgi:hypothetical protein
MITQRPPTIAETIMDMCRAVCWLSFSMSAVLFFAFTMYRVNATYNVQLRAVENRYVEDQRVWEGICKTSLGNPEYFYDDGICSKAARSTRILEDIGGRRHRAWTNTVEEYLEWSGLRSMCGDGFCKSQLILSLEWFRGSFFGTASLLTFTLLLGWLMFGRRVKKNYGEAKRKLRYLYDHANLAMPMTMQEDGNNHANFTVQKDGNNKKTV